MNSLFGCTYKFLVKCGEYNYISANNYPYKIMNYKNDFELLKQHRPNYQIHILLLMQAFLVHFLNSISYLEVSFCFALYECYRFLLLRFLQNILFFCIPANSYNSYDSLHMYRNSVFPPEVLYLYMPLILEASYQSLRCQSIHKDNLQMPFYLLLLLLRH